MLFLEVLISLGITGNTHKQLLIGSNPIAYSSQQLYRLNRSGLSWTACTPVLLDNKWPAADNTLTGMRIMYFVNNQERFKSTEWKA